MEHELWHLTGSLPWGHWQPESPPRVKQIQDKSPAMLPLPRASPSPAFSLEGYNSNPFFHMEKNIDSESFAKLWESLLCCFSIFRDWNSPVKAGLEAESTVSWISLKTALFYFFSSFKTFLPPPPPKLSKSAFGFLNHSTDSSNNVQLNKATPNKPEWHLGPCTACHPFHQCFPFLFGGYYLSVLFVWQFFLGFANIVWFL